MIEELPGRARAMLGTTDTPRHDRLRALSQAAFTRKSAAQLIAPTLEIAERALDRIAESGQLVLEFPQPGRFAVRDSVNPVNGAAG
jgi:cytochrome P450